MGVENATIARELLDGVADLCLLGGLDRTLAQLQPRLDNAKAGQLAACLLVVLELTPVDEVDRTITLPHRLRVEIMAALTSVIDRELAVPQIREAIVTKARALCEERHLPSFEKLVAQLDERGQRIEKQPKIPLDASQAIQHHLHAARTAVLEGAARVALDRGIGVLANANAEAAARLGESVSDFATRRDVAVRRVLDARVPKLPAALARSLFESLSELANLAWAEEERTARAYSATQTFAVGELVEHPKFGRGTVVAVATQRMDVEFESGKSTLVHARK
jgi:hypothetical protein